mgnify:CR=1 FL=1
MIKLQDAKCPNCGANMKVNDKLENTICQYCGSQVIIEDAIEKYKLEISGKVEVDGINSLSKLYKNAESYIRLKDYNSAFNTYQKIINDNPEEILAYKGALIALSQNMARKGNHAEAYPSCVKDLIDTYINYIKTLDVKSEHKVFIEKFCKYINEQYKEEANDRNIKDIEWQISCIKRNSQGFNHKCRTMPDDIRQDCDRVINMYNNLDEIQQQRISEIKEVKDFREKLLKEEKFFSHGIGLIIKWYFFIQIGLGILGMITEMLQSGK